MEPTITHNTSSWSDIVHHDKLLKTKLTFKGNSKVSDTQMVTKRNKEVVGYTDMPFPIQEAALPNQALPSSTIPSSSCQVIQEVSSLGALIDHDRSVGENDECKRKLKELKAKMDQLLSLFARITMSHSQHSISRPSTQEANVQQCAPPLASMQS